MRLFQRHRFVHDGPKVLDWDDPAIGPESVGSRLSLSGTLADASLPPRLVAVGCFVESKCSVYNGLQHRCGTLSILFDQFPPVREAGDSVEPTIAD